MTSIFAPPVTGLAKLESREALCVALPIGLPRMDGVRIWTAWEFHYRPALRGLR